MDTSFLSWCSTEIVRHAVFPLWIRRDHPEFARYRKEFEKTQYLRKSELQNLQLERLRDLLKHAHRSCPLYRARMDASGFDPCRLTCSKDLENLPLLTKRDIQDYGAKMLAGGFPETERIRNQSGGSTGSPVQFYVDKRRFDSRIASVARHDAWAGLLPGDWLAFVWGAPMDMLPGSSTWNWLRKHLIYRRIELNTSSIGPRDWQTFITELRRVRPRVLLAYAQSAVLFAQYVRDHGITDLRFVSIITTSEVLLPEQRQLLQDTFGGTVFNRYGCREVSILASECEYHSGLHVNAEALLVEVVPDKDIPAPAGKIVVTDLLNYSMPLIRYEIGDVGAWAVNQQCACGRGLPLLASLEGRVTDFIVLSDGRRLSGVALSTLVFANMSEVRQAQFVQTSLNDLLLRIVPSQTFGPRTCQEIRRRLAPYLEQFVDLTIEQVDALQIERSGKYRFVINQIPNGASISAAGGETDGLV